MLGAQLTVNDSGPVTTTATQQLRLRGRIGENLVEGHLLSETRGPALWRLDFAGTANFVAGSLRIDDGQVVARDGHSVVFRLRGRPGPSVRFRFYLHEQ